MRYPQATTTRQMRCYKLRTLQQPVRARMCGFGDRDRRLLTPPVIVELLVYDSFTGRQINAHEVDTTFFVLNVDLWDPTCTQELNIVLHPVYCNPESTSSYRTTPEHPAPIAGPSTQALSDMTIAQSSGQYSSTRSPHCDYLTSDTATKSNNEMAYSRNLIGALAQSACKLKGMDGNNGIFFIFHDLSIRTEGIFRLRFMFLALGINGHISSEPTEILATNFSEPFQVYSAKKFPGMLAPTELTKHFASQRVRIPTRTCKSKEGESGSSNDQCIEGVVRK